MSWTDERVALLKRLWSEGKSVSAIAREMGISRNAVAGKAQRSGCASRKSPIIRSIQPEPEPDEYTMPRDLKSWSCRWPIGDPKDRKNFRFCGKRRHVPTSYCLEHHQRSRQRR